MQWSWVMWAMGQLCDGSHGSWVTKDDPFDPSLHPVRIVIAGRIDKLRKNIFLIQ